MNNAVPLFWVWGLCSLAWQLGYWVFWAGYRDKFGCIGLRVAIDQGAFSLRVPIAIVVYVGETPIPWTHTFMDSLPLASMLPRSSN